MYILERIQIPRLFSAYAHNVEHFYRGHTEYRTMQYYCLACGSTFRTDFKYQGWSKGFSDSRVICPQCGEKHADMYRRYITRYLADNEAAPIGITLSVVECKNHVALQLFAKTVRFSELNSLIEAKVEEEFRFDTKTRKTTFKRKIDRKVVEDSELGNPFDLHVLNTSLLRYLNPESCDEEQRKRLTIILKIVREKVHKNLEKTCGHKLKSMYTSCGSCRGRMLVPLFNIAFRMIFLDAPNLPEEYKGFRADHFWAERAIYDTDKFIKLASFRKKNNYIDGLIDLYDLPDVRSVRKILQQDFFSFCLLAMSKSLTANIDYLVAFYPLLQCAVETRRACYEPDVDDLMAFYADIKQLYGDEGLLRLLRLSAKDHIIFDDIRQMYARLSVENKNLLTNVKLSDLHDWLTAKVEEQQKVGFSFDVPEEIKKRLVMQKDSVKFFLPDRSSQLSVAGKELHNCVGSYSECMGTNEIQIVLVAEDKGKLVACLEIRNGQLIQAKLKYNKPVLLNAKINAEVTDWAKKTNIDIKNCRDVRTIYLPAVIAAAV